MAPDPRSPPADTLPSGRIVERVASREDPSEAYAVYLPDGFETTRKWPVLLLLDARGRALLPLRLYREAAERYGYVVMSAYGSLSDGPIQPTERALDAMLRDAQERFAADTRRLYLVGFSGTARLAWIFARSLRGHVAGIVGWGAGLPPGVDPARFESLGEPPFSFFGGSGYVDFNFEEMRALRPTLEDLGIPNQVRHWEGGHGWPPAGIAEESVAWMEAHAMKAGLVEARPRWLSRRLAEGLEEARSLAEGARPLEARERYRGLLETFGGIADVTAVEERLDRLEESDRYLDALDAATARARRRGELLPRLDSIVQAAWRSDDPPDVERTVDRLEIPELRAEAEGGEGEDAAWAERLLEDYMSRFSFYLPRSWTEVEKSEHALAALRVAERIFPERRARICYRRGLIFAVEGRAEETLEQIECVLESSAAAARRLMAEPALRFLADDRRFEELRRRVPR
ncbi:MAG: hypothetical protein GWM92_14695 [Gemmatimonadetes bacterium]|nr:hypothetical protein [Gemmatimonadota bacterium]NIR79993.1 hypothetical protein [Gemmatimonadota bacterium]NIT88724.1 hypothetical protein [Gemmatimonadota bacterium]NIU32531.1 hypothetical protein [Gemmatimonadota bacterium]NIU37001.1 hypothetical protein [Gemmatimonadota bacterium]